MPAAEGDLFDTAGHGGEGKRLFVVAKLEVDAAVRNFNFGQTICGGFRRFRGTRFRSGTLFGECRRRKPSLEIPAAFRILNEDEAWVLERERAEFEMAAKQAQEAQPRREPVRAQKIFVAERGIFSDGDAVRIETRQREERDRELLHVNAAPKRPLEVRNHGGTDAMRAERHVHAELQHEHEEDDADAPLPIFSEFRQQLCRRFRGKCRQKFRRVQRKKVGNPAGSRNQWTVWSIRFQRVRAGRWRRVSKTLPRR